MATRRRRQANDVDRLSELPDCLLHDILSRLKARQLVQTCVLSSRWRRLWLAAPCLDIDAGGWASVARRLDKVNFKPLFSGDDDDEDDEELNKFDDFVDNLLLRRGDMDAPLATLRLSLPSSWPIWMRLHNDNAYCKSHTRWIRRGLRCSPAALDVTGIKMPPLASGPGTRRLTKLRLENVSLHKDFQKHLSSGLPVLQYLEIRRTEMSDISRIASDTLENLIVDNSPTSNEGTRLCFLVDAPRLTSLHLVVQFRRLGVFDVAVCEAAKPVQASIHFLDKPKGRQVHGGCYYWQDDKDLVTALCKLLQSLSNVSCLELSGFGDMAVAKQHVPEIPSPGFFPPQVYWYTTMVTPDDDLLPRPILQAILDEKQNKFPQFHKLKTLVLDKCEIGDNIQTLWSFLHNMPLLEKLTLNNCGCQEFPYGVAASNIHYGT